MFFASSDVNRTSVKVSLQQYDLLLEITLLLNAREQMESMKQATFWRCFLTEDEL